MEFNDVLAVVLFGGFILLLFTGFPIAWLLGGFSLIVAGMAIYVDLNMQDWLVEAFPNTWLDISWRYMSAIVRNIWSQAMANEVLVALPMFIFMGYLLDRSGIAEALMKSFARVFGPLRGGYAITVIMIGILLAASTGVVGASVVLLALLGLPVMLNNRYHPTVAVGTVTAVGTLGILIPPSIMLVLMADRLAISPGGLFMGALLPGLMLASLYVLYIVALGFFRPSAVPAPVDPEPITPRVIVQLLLAVLPPFGLIFAVLGTIFFGIATPTEAAGVGALGAGLLALANGKLSFRVLKEVSEATTRSTAFILAIVVGAVAFAHVLRGLEGDLLIRNSLLALDLGPTGTLIVILLIVFLLGFVLDWIQIVLVILPLAGALIGNPSQPMSGMWMELGFEGPEQALIWFTLLFAIVLQTSFLTPPVGFALFYVKGVAPPGVTLMHIYKGVIPFILLQGLAVVIVFFWRDLVLWLPGLAPGG
ncbi:MAG: TRAP transporter large permease subunit [Geminicoccaceae bacterium]|nr:MAG: TRAP transporter large permease subunit [Geminicoccaceae bacterium]